MEEPKKTNQIGDGEDYIQFVQSAIAYARTASLTAAEEANQASRSISTNLIAIGGFILAFSISGLAAPTIQLSSANSAYITISWAFILVSLAFGITQLLLDYKFFSRRSRKTTEIEILLSKRTFNTSDSYIAYIEDNAKDLKQSGSIWPLLVQIITLALGVIILLFVMGTVLITSKLPMISA